MHEARDRVGGRVHTVRGLPGGLYGEAGGSFISTGDRAIRGLARELRVPLSGDSVSDLATGWTWPGHPGQHTETRLIVCLTGASGMPKVSGAPVHGIAPRRLADTYLRDLETTFAGEHTAHYANRSTMNGAVRSGELAAREVVAFLR